MARIFDAGIDCGIDAGMQSLVLRVVHGFPICLSLCRAADAAFLVSG